MKSWIVGGVLALALTGVGVSRGATLNVGDSVHVTMTGLGPGLYNQVSVSSPVSYSYYAGALDWRLDTVNGNSVAPTTIYTFCIQMTQHVSNGGYTFTVQSLVGAPLGGTDPHLSVDQAALIQGLVDTHYSDILSTPINAAAMQVAIWEILYDGGTSPDVYNSAHGASGFAASATNPSDGATALARAQNWLTNLTPDYNVTSLALVNNGDQDQMIAITPVPLPAALPMGAAMLVGMAGLAAVRKVRRRV
jgi:hypothetical protein